MMVDGETSGGTHRSSIIISPSFSCREHLLEMYLLDMDGSVRGGFAIQLRASPSFIPVAGSSSISNRAHSSERCRFVGDNRSW
jgi:hypothetical protein